MKRNRLITFLSLSLLLLALLTACSGSNNSSTDAGEAHTHTAGEEWDRDLTTHWNLCACGEVMNTAEHTLEEDVCSVCGSEIWAYDDGSGDIYNYDANGNLLRTTSYNNIGTLTSDFRIVPEYDADGNIIRDKQYENGILLAESEYARSSTGESYEAQNISYEADGSHSVSRRNEFGDTLAYFSYAADGTLLAESSYEYAETEDGIVYQSKCTDIDHESGVTYVSEYNRYNDQTLMEEYDGTGSLVDTTSWERDYDEDGNPLWQKTYQNGRLTFEIPSYLVWTDAYGWSRFPSKEISYYEDGSSLVTTYTERGDVASDVSLLSDGTVAYETSYTYEYDEADNLLRASTYENGRLTSLREYSLIDGWSVLSRQTDYAEDGSYTVAEYDENEEITSETAYDAAGNVVS